MKGKYTVSWEGLHKWKRFQDTIRNGNRDLIPLSDYKQWIRNEQLAIEAGYLEQYRLKQEIRFEQSLYDCSSCGIQWDGNAQCQCVLINYDWTRSESSEVV